MQFTVVMGYNASYEIDLADKYPNIRIFTVGQNTISPTVRLFHLSTFYSLYLFIYFSLCQTQLLSNKDGLSLRPLLQEVPTGRISFSIVPLLFLLIFSFTFCQIYERSVLVLWERSLQPVPSPNRFDQFELGMKKRGKENRKEGEREECGERRK